MKSGRCNDHRLSLPTDLVHGHITEMLQHYRGLLRYIMRMQRLIFLYRSYTGNGIQFRIIRNVLDDLVIHLIGHVILQNIKDKMLFNRLPH